MSNLIPFLLIPHVPRSNECADLVFHLGCEELECVSDQYPQLRDFFVASVPSSKLSSYSDELHVSQSPIFRLKFSLICLCVTGDDTISSFLQARRHNLNSFIHHNLFPHSPELVTTVIITLLVGEKLCRVM